MVIHDETLKLRSGKFSIQREVRRNLGFTERLVSVFLGGALLSKGITNPFKSRFWYGAYLPTGDFPENVSFMINLELMPGNHMR